MRSLLGAAVAFGLLNPTLGNADWCSPSRYQPVAHGASEVILQSFTGTVGAAVILLEFDDRRTGKILFEAQNVTKIRPTPTIDRLPVVPHDTNIAMIIDERFNNRVLGGIGVMILVDKDLFKFLLVFVSYLRLLSK